MLRINYQFFEKVSKASRKGSLELQDVQNCTTIACTSLITHKTFKKRFAGDRIAKFEKTRPGGWGGD